MLRLTEYRSCARWLCTGSCTVATMGKSPKSPRVLTHSPTATVRTQNTIICRRLYVLYKMSSMRSEESSSVTSPDHAPSTTEDRASTRFAPICKRDTLRVSCTQQLAAMKAAVTSEMALPSKICFIKSPFEGKVVGNPRRE